MESTYVVNRAGKMLNRICVVVSMACVGGVAALGVKLVRRLAGGLPANKQEVAFIGLCFCVVFGLVFLSCILMALRGLRYSVTLSDESIRVGDETIRLDEIQSIDHPARAVGSAFRILTLDGRSVYVSSVENAHQLEDALRGKLASLDGAAGERPRGDAVESIWGWKWCVLLTLGQLLAAGGMTVALVAFLASVGSPSPLSRDVGILAELPETLVLLVALASSALMIGVRRLSAYSVVVLEKAVRAGEVTARWDEIREIQHVEKSWWLAFYIRMRDGQKLNVYSGLANVGELEDRVRNKLNDQE